MRTSRILPCVLIFAPASFVAYTTVAAAQDEGSLCALPADPGPCDGICPRFFYDVCTGQCESFTYGCCEGNANNFETLEQCQAACPPPEDICFLPADAGPCDGVCPRFFYDACTGQCESFVWGCCEGNANNFETQTQCEAACPLPAEPSPPIPTVSTWNLVIFAMLLLTAGSLVALRRKALSPG